MKYRIGTGFDVHAVKEGDSIMLGGVKIPSPFALKGHSDADVLLHAMTDAILGALAEGDIGEHFPDTSEINKGRDSVDFIRYANDLAHGKGYKISNMDSSVICEKPKLQAFKKSIQENISRILDIPPDCIGIKATTTEKLGFTGRNEGIAAQAVVLLEKI